MEQNQLLEQNLYEVIFRILFIHSFIIINIKKD
jgi:hypothetical protein